MSKHQTMKTEAVEAPWLAEYISNPFKLLGSAIKQFLSLNLGTVFMLALTMLGVVIAIGALAVSSFLVDSESFRLVTVVLGVLSVFAAIWAGLRVTVGLYAYSVGTMRNQEITYAQAWSAGKGRLVRFFLLELLKGLGIVAGFIFFIVPGVYLAYRWSMSEYVFIDNPDFGVTEVLSRSSELVKGRFWEIAGTYGAVALLSLVGVVPVVGWIFSILISPINSLTWAARYESLRRFEGAARPKVDGINYLSALVVPLVFAFSIAAPIIWGGNSTSDQDTEAEFQEFLDSIDSDDSLDYEINVQ